ncbi:hypothetical protein FD51_GL001494 [Lacticaseibacillus zeae DSM 20178 = KCTC 3804]|uniref:Uncharacterized protein n=2 Tax=Lacticaseibacillus zeae TaxID=57037 RepID=A0A5R8LMW8_LACZE|nr:hypothetical protein [Lacticaseibacillus zeae]KRK13290.1 hypothetical protein FD51_GL001494 [Lacticaseibacillus zeae DSM 20178 = KCTC 3804]OLS08102.1 hypothetical protein AUQ39_08170 [Lacticaseibacillus casei]QVI32118.1 hypothetical protein KG087_00275 [Lacticaseibacillus zeae]TLF38551.1 hypothetical protein FEI14_14045 [Lacticaseibacillus zeae]
MRSSENNKSGKLLASAVLCTFILFLISVLWALHTGTKLAKTTPLILVLILSILSYRQYQPNTTDKKRPLFVPKAFGVGLGINPNHPVGRLIWYLIFVVVTALIVFVAFSD